MDTTSMMTTSCNLRRSSCHPQPLAFEPCSAHDMAHPPSRNFYIAIEDDLLSLLLPTPIPCPPNIAPVLISPAQEDSDEDIIFFGGAETYGAYKRVDKKIRPVPGVIPEEVKVVRQFPEDPLESLVDLPVHPPEFQANGRLTEERLKELAINTEGFMWPEEERLFQHILKVHQDALVFEDSQRGSFREDYFSPYIIPTVPHEPWSHANIPIPPGIRERVIELLQEKIAAGVYEPSQSSYRSRWFCVLKKNGKLRLVHDLQPLNKISIKEAGLPPNLDSFVEPFAGRQCYTVLDLYWGFDARKVHPMSRDLTAFQTPLGLLRITSLPTGYTNSPEEFQACMAFILQSEMPHTADIFIDDLAIKGPESTYLDEAGEPETIPGNPGIRRFIWEHAQDVHRIVHRVQTAGGTFSPNKIQLARQVALILGHKCTPEGRLPDDQKIEKVLKWPPLSTVKEVRGFLGLCGTVRIWIKNYSLIARPLTELVRKDEEFVWNERREEAFQTLKQLITSAPALKPLDYQSNHHIVLSVDSSIIAVEFILSQEDEKGKKRPARYGSIPMNEREARYSQPKLELYGLFRALRAYRLYLIGVKHLKVEVDAKYIKGMLNEPDLQPNATINRWIQGVLLFDFDLVHVPADKHRGPDALSRRKLAEGEKMPEEDDSWLDDIALLVDNLGPVEGEPDTIAVYHTSASLQDLVLKQIYHFLDTLETPIFPSTTQKQRFIKRAMKFFIQDGKLYKRNGTNPPLRAILDLAGRLGILQDAHEGLGHRGERAVFQLVHKRFYWPHLWNDVRHHVQSCHQCQIRSTRKVQIPLQVSAPAALFARIYVDVMRMPPSRKSHMKYIVAARDYLTGGAEGRALKEATAEALAAFFWECIFCRYGAVYQVTTDNGPEVKGAFSRLMDKYGIPLIRISPYNSRANGVVERGHFTIREAIVKACGPTEDDVKNWPDHLPHAFFADRITTRPSTNYSPYYLIYGTEPLLPFDLTEASFLSDSYRSGMSTVELIAARIRQLEKRPEDIAKAAALLAKHRFKSKEQFEKKFEIRLQHETYPPGTLVLIRNTAIEKELNRKTKPCYLGPYEVVRQTSKGAYVVQKLDGTVCRYSIAAFRVVPYIKRSDLPLLAATHTGQ